MGAAFGRDGDTQVTELFPMSERARELDAKLAEFMTTDSLDQSATGPSVTFTEPRTRIGNPGFGVLDVTLPHEVSTELIEFSGTLRIRRFRKARDSDPALIPCH